MAKPKNACMRAVLWAALAAIILFAAGSCGRGHGEGRLSTVSTLPSAKTASNPPVGNDDAPWDISAQVVGAQIQAQWRGKNNGDYDLDGTVSIADITPLAVNFSTTVNYSGGFPVEDGPNEYYACVDGDGDKTIGISDITPIAQHFGQSCIGYRIYLGLRATGETEFTWSASYETPPGDATSLVTAPFNESRNAGEVQRYSFSLAKPSGFDGFAKVRIVATDGTDEGALAESSEFSITSVADTTPPFNSGGITGLAAAAKPGRVILSWGTWEDETSPPVDIEIAWGVPPLDTNSPEHDTVIDAAAQTYQVSSLANDQEYEFSCRFLDHAAPANATAWLTPISATPSAHLYALPPAGAAEISLDAGLSPSVDSFPDASAVHDQFAPAVAYISAGGSNAGQLMFARYDDGAWSSETVRDDTFSACSILTAGDFPVIVATRLTPAPGVSYFWNDAELHGWSSHNIFDGAVSNIKIYPNTSDLEHPYIIFTTAGASPTMYIVYWDGSAWVQSPYILGFADSIIDLSVTQKPEGSLQVLVTHGTVDGAQAQIDSTIACLAWDTVGQAWMMNGDFGIPNDIDGNNRAAFNTTFWPYSVPNFLGAASAIRIVPTNILFVGWVDVPYSDVLGMVPGGFGTQQDWVDIKKGTTTINPFPLGLILNWYIEPRWAEGDDTIVFVNVAGTLTMSYDGQNLNITGGSLAPTWWTATYNGASWSASPLTIGGAIPSGRGHDLAPSDTAGGFQMVYTQVDTMDVDSLLGGGTVTGGIYYARK